MLTMTIGVGAVAQEPLPLAVGELEPRFAAELLVESWSAWRALIYRKRGDPKAELPNG